MLGALENRENAQVIGSGLVVLEIQPSQRVESVPGSECLVIFEQSVECLRAGVRARCCASSESNPFGHHSLPQIPSSLCFSTNCPPRDTHIFQNGTYLQPSSSALMVVMAMVVMAMVVIAMVVMAMVVMAMVVVAMMLHGHATRKLLLLN